MPSAHVASGAIHSYWGGGNAGSSTDADRELSGQQRAEHSQGRKEKGRPFQTKGSAHALETGLLSAFGDPGLSSE